MLLNRQKLDMYGYFCLSDDIQSLNLYVYLNLTYLIYNSSPSTRSIENPSQEQIKSLALRFIRDLLQKNNSGLDQHHLSSLAHEFQPVRTSADRLTHNERNYDYLCVQAITQGITLVNMHQTVIGAYR
jgi:hypothetical protein